MIALTKYITATGEIFGQISVSSEEDAMLNTFSLEMGQALIEGHFDGRDHYVIDGEAVSRPVTGLPASHDLAVGVDWSVADVPEGTQVLIDGVEVGEVDATGLVLSFSLAGVWSVDLVPPFPWVEASCEVTVT